MENKDDELNNEDFENGQNEEYLLTKEEHFMILSFLSHDLEQICYEIEDNLSRAEIK